MVDPTTGSRLLAYQQLFSFPGRSAIPTNGGRYNMTSFSLDGSNANDNYTNVADPLPNPDAIQEMVVQTNNFSARYGQNGGAIVNVVTRSGTNNLHGSAFEYLRNDALNAHNFFSNKTDGLKRNQFGFSVGGPVWLPHIYNGKNRTFFFTSYQDTINRTLASSNLAILPTGAERNGDFSALPVTLTDPLTGLPLPGNQIPANRIGTVAAHAFQYLAVPAPLPGLPAGATYFYSNSNTDLYQYLVKIDHYAGAKNLISGRYFITNYSQPGYWANDLLTAHAGEGSRYQSFALSDTYTFAPNLLNQFFGSFDRTETVGDLVAPLGNHDDFGMNIFAPEPSEVAFYVNGLFHTDTGNNFRSPRNTFQYQDNLSWIRGRHQLTFGGMISRIQMALDEPYIAAGLWTYDGSLTGNAMADFIIGSPNFFQQGGGQYVQIRGTTYGFFVEDRYKTTSRLTLNLGLRYEPYFPFHDKQHKGILFTPGEQSTTFPNAPPGLLFVGDPGVPMGLEKNEIKNLAPRFGFAYDLTGKGKFIVRGGYGIFYDLPPTKTYIAMGSTPPWSSEVDVTDPPSDADPLALVGNPFPQPLPSKTTPIPRPLSFGAYNPDRATSYIQSWNLTLEKQIANDLVARASYAGSKGTHLETQYEGNPAVYIPSASSTANTQNRRIYNSDGLGDFYVLSTEGNSNYHSMQLQLDYRWSTLEWQAGYTFSKSIDSLPLSNGTSPAYSDPFDKNLDHGLSDFDVTHRFVLSYVWALPQARSLPTLARLVVGGWSTSGIVSAQTGFPLIIRAGQDRSLSGVGLDYAEVVGDPQIANPSIQKWFNAAAFTLPPLGSFGENTRGLVRGPGYWNLDLSAAKEFSLGETRKLQFRSEFFNALNHPSFLSPSSGSLNPTSPLFGRITSYYGPRIIQLSLRLQF